MGEDVRRENRCPSLFCLEIYTQKIEYKEFLQDIKTQDAVVRNLEIIGEVVKNISKELRKKFYEIPWKELAGVRDRLIHKYFGVNYEEIAEKILFRQESTRIFIEFTRINSWEFDS